MKRGYFETESETQRPYVEAALSIPLIGNELVRIEFGGFGPTPRKGTFQAIQLGLVRLGPGLTPGQSHSC